MLQINSSAVISEQPLISVNWDIYVNAFLQLYAHCDPNGIQQMHRTHGTTVITYLLLQQEDPVLLFS